MSRLFSTGSRDPKHDCKEILLLGLRGARHKSNSIDTR
jgi:hypothetical protein